MSLKNPGFFMTSLDRTGAWRFPRFRPSRPDSDVNQYPTGL